MYYLHNSLDIFFSSSWWDYGIKIFIEFSHNKGQFRVISISRHDLAKIVMLIKPIGINVK